ncbi:calcium:proton antiporter [Massilibacteroides vaginae]|uniref:calcium:proton antiporter n=1 Tax=Massilibacteroides vaginae TaxID=1673718 RepID=UPI000A1CE0D0|nr:calcium:proton antiporter [Massilibacteroides vaginae]
MSTTNTNSLSINKIIPTKTRIRLLAAWSVVLLFSVWGDSILGDSIQTMSAVFAFVILLVTIIAAAFGVVREADELAHKLGEPYGTLILTLSIVAIEVILIAAVMLGPGESPTIGKDSIFSVMMIIMNLVIGLCILIGGLKYGEQEYNAQGTMSYIAMIIMLGGLSMLLPNFIEGSGNGIFSTMQTITLAMLITLLYALFLFFQMKAYSHLYVQPPKGKMNILFEEKQIVALSHKTENGQQTTDTREITIRSVILIAMILPIVLLSHSMAIVVDFGINAANLPSSLGGVLIAIIVFTPESMTAIKAAFNNEFQRVVNLCHGAFVSTVGLTVPAVLTIGLITNKTVQFGLTPSETILFIITLLLSLITFLGKRTTPMTGIMHLALFIIFVMLVFNP